MDFTIIGKTFHKNNNYQKILPMFLSQREKLVNICKTNPLLHPVKTVLSGDLMETIVCSRVSVWVLNQQEIVEDSAISKEITFQISRELIRQKVGDKIPLLIQTSKNNA